MSKYLTTAAVMTGSLILFIPLSVIALVGSFEIIHNMLGFGPTGIDDIGLFGWLIVFLFAYVTAMEIARVQIHGFEELHRGTHLRVMARHGILVTVATAAIVSLVGLLLDGLSTGLKNGQMGIAVGALACLVVLGWVIIQSLKSFGKTI